jgi:hypothetical protein
MTSFPFDAESDVRIPRTDFGSEPLFGVAYLGNNYACRVKDRRISRKGEGSGKILP